MSSEDNDSPEEFAEQIRSGFAEEYEDYDLDKLTDKVEQFQGVNGIDDSEVQRAVTTSVVNDLNVPREELLGGSGGGGGGAGTVSTEDAKSMGDDEWVTLRVTVTEVNNNHDSDAVGQKGVLADETGTIRFTAWAKSELDALEEGKSYELESVVTDEWNGNISVNLNSSTEIEELDEDIEAGDDNVEVTGCLVALQSGSGLIKRCTEEDDNGNTCNRALRNGQCGAHGDVEGEHDIRLMAVLDAGTDIHQVVVGNDLTADLTGIGKDEAVEMAMDALDTEVVADAMSERVLGRYYTVEGPELGRYVNADDIEVVDEVEYDEDILIRARSMNDGSQDAEDTGGDDE